MLYNSNSLKIYLRGSVIPFLSLREYKKILLPLLENPKREDLSTQKKLKELQDIEALLLQQEQKNTYYKQLKSLIASEVLKSFNKQ